MGVALALTLVCSMGVAFLPASTPAGPESAEAGTLGWSNIGLPSATGNVLVTQPEDLGPIAVSPNFASDNTVFATINEAGAAPLVYKSTNGGHTWTACDALTLPDYGPGAGVTYAAIALEVSNDYANDSTLFLAVQDPAGGPDTSGDATGRVFRSVNGGSSFGQLGEVAMAAGEVITCMDVAPNYDGTGTLAIGVADKATIIAPASRATCVQIWAPTASSPGRVSLTPLPEELTH